MTTLQDPYRLLLEVVRDSRGGADTRNIDYEFYRRAGESKRSSELERSLLAALRDLETRGLVEEVPIPGGTGPGWRRTPAGEQGLSGNPGPR